MNAAGISSGGISRNGVLYAGFEEGPFSIRLEICMDCDNIVRWVNGTWKMFNARYADPMLQAMDRDPARFRVQASGSRSRLAGAYTS